MMMNVETLKPTGPPRRSWLLVVSLAALFWAVATVQPLWAQALGAASSFAVKGGTSVTNAGTATINGDLGVSPGTSITGAFAVTPPFGTHNNDGAAILAQASILTLYNDLVALPGGTNLLPELSNVTINTPGTYNIGAAQLSNPGGTLTGVLTFSGPGPFYIRVSSSLTTGTLSNVIFVNGAEPCQGFWQVTSAATLNGLSFGGNVVAQSGITLGSGTTLTGRALTLFQGAITMPGTTHTIGGCSGSAPLSLLLKKQALTATFLNAGDPISYSYVVTNTSATALVGPVTVLDDKVSVVCPIVSTLLPGDSVTCAATYFVSAADVTAGFVTNKASGLQGNTVSNEDTTTVKKAVAQAAAITIVKKTNGIDNNVSTGPIIAVGGAVHWTYIVKNTGNVTLTSVTVTDNQGVTVTCPGTTLGAGQSMTCTANGVAIAGQYTNFGTATGIPPAGLAVSAIDIDHYFGKAPRCPFPPPAITVFSVVNVPPVTVTLKVQAPGGLQSIVVTALTNATVVPSSLVFPLGTTGPVFVVVKKVNANLGSVIGLEANDNCNVTIFDPVVVTVNPPPLRCTGAPLMLIAVGKLVATVYGGVPPKM